MTDIATIAKLIQHDRVTYTLLSDGTAVMLLVDGREVLTLNETAARIVEGLKSGITDEDELVRQLTDEFAVDAATARRDVRAFLAELARHCRL